MFCSFCKKIEYIHECSRRICSNGHIACEDCGDGLEICPECCVIEDFKESLVKFSRLIHVIENFDLIPFKLIVSIIPDQVRWIRAAIMHH